MKENDRLGARAESRKRPASRDLRDVNAETWERQITQPESFHPDYPCSLPLQFHDGNGVPDTLSVRSTSPDNLSVAPTPRIDDEISDIGETDEEEKSCGSESGLEDDWQE